MKTLHGAIATLFAAIFTAALCLGQAPAARKSYTFHGQVVAVNKDTHRLTVDGEKVDGWMRAMTMNYKVDNPSIIAKLKPGDRITATVYDGDHVLHNVTAAGPAITQAASGPAVGQVANKQPRPARHDYRVPQDRLWAFVRAQPCACQQMMWDLVSCAEARGRQLRPGRARFERQAFRQWPSCPSTQLSDSVHAAGRRGRPRAAGTGRPDLESRLRPARQQSAGGDAAVVSMRAHGR